MPVYTFCISKLGLLHKACHNFLPYMLNDLISLIDSYEFEEYGTLDLARVRVEGDVLIFSLNLNTGGNSDAFQGWEVEGVGCLEHQIALGQCDGSICNPIMYCSGPTFIRKARYPSMEKQKIISLLWVLSINDTVS